MIDPERVPQFTGDLAQLEEDCGGLRTVASDVRSTGQEVDRKFQGLAAYYRAPEAERLFATTKPVADRADGFATGLETVSGALSAYATEVRPLVAKLEQLKVDAADFAESVKGDDDWEYDGDKVDKCNRIRDDVTATVAAFWAAERECHNRITALWGGTQMVAEDGSDREDQYGYNAADMKNAELPWGDPVEEKHHWYEIGHWVKSFVWDGIVVDGVWGTIKGLGTLAGIGGWDAMGQAWKGLARLATGLAVSSVPGAAAVFWASPDAELPSWLRDSRTAMKRTGKALVAWNEWGRNPARAAGAVTFNAVTTVLTGGEGAAAGAGVVAKAVSVAGRAGRAIDPMTYVGKAAGAGLSKIGDAAKALKGVGNVEIPKLPDGSVHLPDGRLLDADGNLMRHDGTLDTTPVPREATPQLPAHAGVHTTDHVPGAHTPHTGHDAPTGHAHPTETTPHGTGHDAGPLGDGGGVPHGTGDIAAHDGNGAANPGHGGGEPFEYKPSMPDRQFSALATDAEKHAVARAELVHGTNPAPSLSDRAGFDYGKAYWNEFLDNLEPASKKSLATYTSNAFDDINGHLRLGAEASADTLHTINEMDKVMGARPVPEDIMVVRGTGVEHLHLDTPLDMRGGVYDDKAYTSTALGKTPPPPFDGKPVWMHLRVPKGTPALWLDHISEFPGERELLLARGTQYRVTRVFMDHAGKWHVYGEVLPRP
ncbi:ADP-ribosyltransferase [Streptomyces sp. NPDC047022]|uniref:ADP-ribosyltransferase n=1 Tax=Streptomyces sp. NPDC047022 TaxID=3155737 RepID=UPI0033F2CE29